MEGIQISQVLSESELKDIVTVDAPDGTFAQLRRIFRQQIKPEQAGAVWVDQVDDDNNLVGDPIAIHPERAVWLLKDFFKMKHWKRIVTPAEAGERRGSVMTESYCYVGKSECGCIQAICIDHGNKQTAEDLAEFIEMGLMVERVTVDYGKNNFMKDCDQCRRPEQSELFSALQ